MYKTQQCGFATDISNAQHILHHHPARTDQLPSNWHLCLGPNKLNPAARSFAVYELMQCSYHSDNNIDRKTTALLSANVMGIGGKATIRGSHANILNLIHDLTEREAYKKSTVSTMAAVHEFAEIVTPCPSVKCIVFGITCLNPNQDHWPKKSDGIHLHCLGSAPHLDQHHHQKSCFLEVFDSHFVKAQTFPNPIPAMIEDLAVECNARYVRQLSGQQRTSADCYERVCKWMLHKLRNPTPQADE